MTVAFIQDPMKNTIFRCLTPALMLCALSAPPLSAQPGSGPGHAFVCTDYNQGKVFVISPEGIIEWEYDGATNANDIWVLPGGNLLFNTGHGVKEVTRDKRVVFHYDSSSEIYACQRLTNGNTFIGECSSGRLLEVAPDGKIGGWWANSKFSAKDKGGVY